MRALLVFHVLAAIAGMGPELAFGIMGPAARRRGAGTALTVYWAISEARAQVVYPAVALQIGSGVALVVRGRHSIVHEAWLTASLISYAIAILLVAAVLVPASEHARRTMANGVEPSAPVLRATWTMLTVGGSLAGTLLAGVAVLMVWKPAT